MSGPELTPEQLEAVERRSEPLVLEAGAGSGKTAVLVERFVRAAREDGVPLEAILAITFTRKAAAEMKLRIRERFLELGDRERARAAEGAVVTTIDGFCARLLQAHPLAAGIDPDFRTLEEVEAARLAVDAFEAALDELVEGADPQKLDAVAAYGPDALGRMVRGLHARLRGRGRGEPRLPEEEGGGGGGGAAYAALGELLALHSRHYERLKRERSALDFNDLVLRAIAVLRGAPGLAARYRRRFEHVLVDELQDTSPLQHELLDLIAGDGGEDVEAAAGAGEGPKLFAVGDELQSIYGFRDAGVGVFRERRDRAAAGGRAARLSASFRARRELLDALNLAYAEVFGEGHRPLSEPPGAGRGAPRLEPCVELLLVDRKKERWDERLAGAEAPFGPAMRTVAPWRAAEARLLALRIDRLTGEDGPFGHGDVAVLLRAATELPVYERALQERGIPTYVAGGRGYWSRLQVADLRAYLAALADPGDEVALHSLLASPLAGASLDALALLGLHAKESRRGAWPLLEEAFAGAGDGNGSAGADGGAGSLLLAALPAPDRERLADFVPRFAAERRAAPRTSLERLIDRAVSASGYDLAVLAMPDGERRLANVRKLMRLARAYEAAEGRDLRGFLGYVADQDLVRGREGEAPLEDEGPGGARAVRLMTIHRAKGLEFPVVCVADLGRSASRDNGALRLAADGRVGLRPASTCGESEPSPQLEEIEREQAAEREAEERRAFYVAMTRAREHLIVSGATDVEGLPEPAPLAAPMRWAWRALAPGLFAAAGPGGEGEAVREHEGREVRVRCVLCSPETVDRVLPEPERAPAPRRREAEAAPAAPIPLPPEPPPAPPEAPALPVGRLSYSGLEAYRRCGYRFYLERVLGLEGEAESRGEEGEGLGALARGSIVHELLERLDFRQPVVPAAGEVEARVFACGEPVRALDVEGLRRLVAAFAASPLCERLAAAELVRAEVPFAFPLGPGLLVNGAIDVHAAEPGGAALVVDYKSDRLDPGADLEALCAERYGTQRLVYALAALRGGAARVEVVHCFLERPEDTVSAAFGAAGAERLERELHELAAGALAGRFEPTDAPHRALCAGCPGQPGLCKWGPERTLADLPPG